jgi:putative hemolysin
VRASCSYCDKSGGSAAPVTRRQTSSVGSRHGPQAMVVVTGSRPGGGRGATPGHVSAPDPFQGGVRVSPASGTWDPVVNRPDHIWKGPGSVPEVRSLCRRSGAFHAAGPGLLRTSRAPPSRWRPPRRLMLHDCGSFTAQPGTWHSAFSL